MRAGANHTIAAAAALLLLAALACNLGGQETPTPTPEEVGEASPTSTPPSEPTSTPVPDVTDPSGCTLNSAYVTDVTVPDDTEMSPGETFVKTWRLRNTGTCDWEAGMVLAFSSGDQMDGPDSVAVPATAAGSTADVSVSLVAPVDPGTYRGNWQVEDSDGTRFGSVVYVRIIVPEPSTEEPTAAPTEEPLAAPTTLVKTTLPSGYVSLVWVDNSFGEDGFRVLADGAIFQSVGANAGGWGFWYTDHFCDQTVQLTVVAYRGSETSPPSNAVSHTGPPCSPATPPDLRVSGLTLPPDVLVTNTPFHVQATVHNDGTQNLSGVKVQVEDHFPHPQASCDNMAMTNILYDTTVNLNAGQALPVDYTVQIGSAWEHLICVKVDPDGGIAESNENNNAQGGGVLVGDLATIQLDAAGSASVRQDGYMNLPYAQPGDSSNNQGVVGFLSWNLSAIPAGAQILEAKVNWNSVCFHGGSAGNCTGERDVHAKLGGMILRAHYFGTVDAGDYASARAGGGTYLATYSAAPNAQSLDVTSVVADALAASHPFQIAGLFLTETDNNNFYDGIRFSEGSGVNTLRVVYIP